ncbi:MAG: 3-oxoacyl-[acyl-carrier-protein] reductase [Bacteroidetes bacterium]|nr:3-oxoacyl-[acyl-carrier-protein] reductase [Bacteroidota bacterium]
MSRFTGRVAVITGGAAGIGRAAVEKFAREGAAVAIWDVNDVQGKELELILLHEGFAAKFIKVNTAKYEEVEAATKAVIAQFGRIDVLVNNAGITRDASLQKMTAENWQQVLDVNLTGVFNCTKAVTPDMISRGSGAIINTSSIVGLYGNYGQSNYAATKSGVIGLTKTWARELGKHNIRVNAVAPGFIATDMINTIPEKVITSMQEKVPLKRLGTPEDVANLYAFLASEEAAFISGAVISVDGGLTI